MINIDFEMFVAQTIQATLKYLNGKFPELTKKEILKELKKGITELLDLTELLDEMVKTSKETKGNNND